MLPVAVATLLLLKVLFEHIFRWEITRESKATSKSIGIRIVFASVAVFLGLLFCFFATLLLFFPSQNIPSVFKILTMMLYFGFWGFAGILYLLARTHVLDGGPITGILKKIFTFTAKKKIY